MYDDDGSGYDDNDSCDDNIDDDKYIIYDADDALILILLLDGFIKRDEFRVACKEINHFLSSEEQIRDIEGDDDDDDDDDDNNNNIDDNDITMMMTSRVTNC